jgi:putative transposase
MLLSYKFRLYPTRIQAAALDLLLGSLCDLYNAALQQRIEAYRRQGRTLRYADQAAELKAVRAADERLAGFSFSTEQQVLRRLDKAFAAFFRRLKKGGKAGFPRFRAKSMFDSAEMRVGDGLTLKRSRRIGVTGIPGAIKVKWHRPLPVTARLGAAVLSRSCGRWFVCFQIELPDAGATASLPHRQGFAPVGIDLGLSALVALSTGETIPTPPITKNAAAALRRRQRKLSRAKRGSRGRTIARRSLARLQAKLAAKRRDGLHKLSCDLTRRFSHLALEDLNIKGMAGGLLAKAVHNAAWAMLAGMVRYKAERAGGVAVFVDPRGTSRICPACGAVAAKTLAMRVHSCACGCVLDRDVAAAREILRRADFHRHGTCRGTPSQRVAA